MLDRGGLPTAILDVAVGESMSDKEVREEALACKPIERQATLSNTGEATLSAMMSLIDIAATCSGGDDSEVEIQVISSVLLELKQQRSENDWPFDMHEGNEIHVEDK